MEDARCGCEAHPKEITLNGAWGLGQTHPNVYVLTKVSLTNIFKRSHARYSNTKHRLLSVTPANNVIANRVGAERANNASNSDLWARMMKNEPRSTVVCPRRWVRNRRHDLQGATLY